MSTSTIHPIRPLFTTPPPSHHFVADLAGDTSKDDYTIVASICLFFALIIFLHINIKIYYYYYPKSNPNSVKNKDLSNNNNNNNKSINKYIFYCSYLSILFLSYIFISNIIFIQIISNH